MWHVSCEHVKKWEWERQPSREKGSGRTSAAYVSCSCIMQIYQPFDMWYVSLLKSESGSESQAKWEHQSISRKMGEGGRTPTHPAVAFLVWQICQGSTSFWGADYIMHFNNLHSNLSLRDMLDTLFWGLYLSFSTRVTTSINHVVVEVKLLLFREC